MCYRIQGKMITVPRKPLFLVLSYLGPLSLQTRIKLRKQVKGILNCCKWQQLSLCNHSLPFDSLSLLTKENKKNLLELKESLLIMRDKCSLKRKIRSPPLDLFGKR